MVLSPSDSGPKRVATPPAALRAIGDSDTPRVDLSEPPRSLFRSRLEAHVQAVLERVRALDETEQLPPRQRAELAARLVAELDRVQQDVPRPGDLAGREDLDLLSGYGAALKALRWGARDILTGIERGNTGLIDRGERWLLDGRTRAEEILREVRETR